MKEQLDWDDAEIAARGVGDSKSTHDHGHCGGSGSTRGTEARRQQAQAGQKHQQRS
jgi:hypothetical protein